jgi:O-antigen ligase
VQESKTLQSKGTLPAVIETNGLQNWVARLDRRVYALLIGLLVGGLGGLVGLLIAAFDPLIAVGAVLGVLIGLYVLTSVSAALYAMVAVMALLPFGTFPVRIGFTPTLLDAALGAFLLVYALLWMTGKRRAFRLTPVHALVSLYMGWLILSFVLGLRYASPTSADLRQFAETLLSISLVFILVDLLRDPLTLRRLVLVVMLAAGTQALIALTLYAMPDATADRTLIRLARVGYPNAGVIRYIEDNPAMPERAIGTWVDPNAFGGFLVVVTAMVAPQVFARKPVFRWRWLSWGVLGVTGLATLLTFSRASMLALALALAFISLFRGYRKFIPLLLAGFVVMLLLPQTQAYLSRFVEAFTGSDLSTQMRLGEYGDALRLIRQYPVTGVGFTGTPSIELYTDAASMYLIMANQIGLVGVALFASVMLGVFAYGLKAWRQVQGNPELRSILLGYHAALVGALLNGTADLYFFRFDFQASNMLLWLTVALALASSRLALETPSTAQSEIVKDSA